MTCRMRRRLPHIARGTSSRGRWTSRTGGTCAATPPAATASPPSVTSSTAARSFARGTRRYRSGPPLPPCYAAWQSHVGTWRAAWMRRATRLRAAASGCESRAAADGKARRQHVNIRRAKCRVDGCGRQAVPPPCTPCPLASPPQPPSCLALASMESAALRACEACARHDVAAAARSASGHAAAGGRRAAARPCWASTPHGVPGCGTDMRPRGRSLCTCMPCPWGASSATALATSSKAASAGIPLPLPPSPSPPPPFCRVRRLCRNARVWPRREGRGAACLADWAG